MLVASIFASKGWEVYFPHGKGKYDFLAICPAGHIRKVEVKSTGNRMLMLRSVRRGESKLLYKNADIVACVWPGLVRVFRASQLDQLTMTRPKGE